MKAPSITVAIPTYNRLDLLKKTIHSVFAQEAPPDEILVVDDASTEREVWEYLKGLERIRLIRNKKNLGSFENINKCIRLAKSDYVIVVQSDDLIMPGCVKSYKDIMEKYGKKPAVYFSGGYNIDEYDKVKGRVRPLKGNQLLEPPASIRTLWDNHWFHILIGGWSAFRRDIFKKVGYFTRNYGRVGEIEMTLKIVPKFPLFYIDRALFAFRIHSLQGLEGQAKKAGIERGIDEAKDASRALHDYEYEAEINKSFTSRERKERIFVRKPIVFLLVISVYYFLTGDSQKAKKYFAIFRKAYPKPIYSPLTAELALRWLTKLIPEHISNALLRFKLRGKKVQEIT